MNIDPIKNGIVIDHITAGKGAQIYSLLGLDSLDVSRTDKKCFEQKAREKRYNKNRCRDTCKL